MTTRYTQAAANAALNNSVAQIDAGTGPGVLRIYSGPQPANASDPRTGTLLAELIMSDPSFAAASGASIVANPISDDASANATGAAGYFDITDSAGVTVFQGDAGTAGTELVLDDANIVAGGTVSITALTLSMPLSSA